MLFLRNPYNAPPMFEDVYLLFVILANRPVQTYKNRFEAMTRFRKNAVKKRVFLCHVTHYHCSSDLFPF